MRRRVLLLLVMASACAHSPRVVEVRFAFGDGRVAVVRAELADTEAARARGLMDRRSLESGAGMLFRWPVRGSRAFYMYRTLIPLDLVSIRDGRVTQIMTMIPCAQAEPDRCPTTNAGSVDEALEIAGGSAARLGISVGQRVLVQGA